MGIHVQPKPDPKNLLTLTPFRLLQKLWSKVPFAGIAGNHEIETQADGSTFVAWNARSNFATNPQGTQARPSCVFSDILMF